MNPSHEPDGGWDPAVAIALNFAEQEQQTAITTVLALDATLASITHEPIDASVAQAKLAWWASEFERFGLGRAQHPLTQTLAHLSVPISQLDPWLRLLATHQAHLESPSAKIDRGAAYGALALLVGAAEARSQYEAVGQAAAPFVSLSRRSVDSRLAAEHAETLAESGTRLRAFKAPTRDRFIKVLAAATERRARAVARFGDAGLNKPGPLALLWVSWRAAIKTQP